MNWTAIAAMSSVGVIMGLLTSLVGLPPAVEPLVWIGFYVAWGVTVVRLQLAPFLSPLLASLASGVWTGVLQFALWESYVQSNPWYAEEIAAAGPITLAPILGFAMGMALFWGLLVGGICWGITRVRGGSPVASVVD